MAKDFVLKGKKLQYAKSGALPTIRVSAEAYNLLVDMANESYMSISGIASQAIKYANENVKYDRGQ